MILDEFDFATGDGIPESVDPSAFEKLDKMKRQVTDSLKKRDAAPLTVAEILFSQILAKVISDQDRLYRITIEFQGKCILQGVEAKRFEVVGVESSEVIGLAVAQPV